MHLCNQRCNCEIVNWDKFGKQLWSGNLNVLCVSFLYYMSSVSIWHYDKSKWLFNGLLRVSFNECYMTVCPYWSLCIKLRTLHEKWKSTCWVPLFVIIKTKLTHYRANVESILPFISINIIHFSRQKCAFVSTDTEPSPCALTSV